MEMNNRTFVNLLLLAAIIPIEELWQLFKGDKYMVDWFLFVRNPLPIQMYVQFLCDHITHILEAILIYRCARMNKIFRIASVVFLSLKVFDLVMFFICFNKWSYLIPYSLLSLITLMVAYTFNKTYLTDMKARYELADKESETEPAKE